MGYPLHEVLLREDNPQDCTKYTCPPSESLYGYLPNKPVNIIFVMLFILTCVAHIYQGVRAKAWTFTCGLAIGAFLEAIGYVGRLLLRNDWFSAGYIGIQLICLTVAPAFLAAGIYLSLKHIIIIYGARFSRIAPKWYTWIFICCDVLSIVTQMAGATLAATANNSDIGTNIMIFGISLQVVTLLAFGILAADVWMSIRKHEGGFNQSTQNLRVSKQFERLLAALIIAYCTIMVRCIYRIAEMAGGWKNNIMQNEASFVILDGVMCITAAVVLNVFHPGFMFKESNTAEKTESSLSEEVGLNHRDGPQTHRV